MFALEVIQNFPPQRKAFMSSLGVCNDNSSTMIKFETMGVQPNFHYYMSLLIHVECLNMTFKRTVIDEGVAACMMSFSCWKGLGSPELSQSATMLTAFDGRSFQPHGILPSLKVQLGGKPSRSRLRWLTRPLTIIFCWVGIGCIVCNP